MCTVVVVELYFLPRVDHGGSKSGGGGGGVGGGQVNSKALLLKGIISGQRLGN